MTCQKHLIRCRCILPQFKQLQDAPLHQFTVLSIIDDDGNVKTKYAQCNNCGVVHRVVDICKSEILTGNEGSPAITTIDDVKASLPENIVALLDVHDVDLATWECVRFIIENQRWGDIVVLASDVAGDERHGKYVRILGERLYKVESFVREERVGK